MIDHKFLSFFYSHKIQFAKKRFLLTVSGGVDSVALAHLFHNNNIAFEIAHCNFKLRGNESDEDEQFVNELAIGLGVKIHIISFDTSVYAANNKIGIQEAARKLRYEWFEKISAENAIDYIVTAHHADDQIETILFNFIKGTGIKGLRGMQPKRDKLIRPLINISKAEILDYCRLNNYGYRNDSSNDSVKYSRNKLRNEIIPAIETVNPSFSETILAQQQVYAHLEWLYNNTIQKGKEKLFQKRGANEYQIPFLLLKKSPIAFSLLYEFLVPFGFNKATCEDIVASFDTSISGKEFFSATHRIVRDRKFLILSPIASNNNSHYSIRLDGQSGILSFGKYKLMWEIADAKDIQISKSANHCYLDMRLVQTPLTLRHFKKGDYFYPFGMERKKKKVSKFFKDNKVPVSDKDKIWILQSGEKIAWIVNHRSDERFRVTNTTEKVLVINVIEQ